MATKNNADLFPDDSGQTWTICGTRAMTTIHAFCDGLADQ